MPPMTPNVTVATVADRAVILESVVAAFATDPVLRWLFPDDATYPAYAEAFFGALFDKRVGRDTVWTIAGRSVAMWDPPASTSVAEDATSPALVDVLSSEAMRRVEAYDEAVHTALPAQPYWYLGVLGTHPDDAGRRWGRQVMAAGLGRACADGLPAVLETSSTSNVALYERSGWKVVTAVSEPVPTWVMRHDAGG